jgi:hypothetical protein
MMPAVPSPDPGPSPSRARRRGGPWLLPAAGLAAALVWVGLALAAPAVPAERRLTFFYTAEAHGTLEPCGCTSDPLGDIARYASAVRAARREAGDVLLVDAGGLSFPEGGAAPRERAGNELRAAFLAEELRKLGLAGAGLAETDLPPGGGGAAPPRLAVNVAPGAAVKTAPSVLKLVNGIRVGVLGVADPALGERLGVKLEEPVASAKREAERLRKAGAEVVIALAPVDRAVARRLAREAAVDFVVLGRQVGKGAPRADSVGLAFILTPADELQRVGRVDLRLRFGGGVIVDAGGPEATELRKGEVARALERIDGELASWKAGAAGADASFVAQKRRERDALAAEKAALAAKPWTPPAVGSYFTNTLVPLSRALPRDPGIAAAMRKLDARIGKLNLASAAPPAPPEDGRPHYVGMDQCASCHKPAMLYWKKTIHAKAWKTLVDVGKQADYKCVSCHVTGYGEVGGTSLGHTQKLENVQCETCHGPGSEHVAREGLEDPPAIQKQVASPLCTNCHNEHHSDTFNYQAYLRDILGPGHGMNLRRGLGDGPTGHELRSAAMAKAKTAGAAALKKL